MKHIKPNYDHIKTEEECCLVIDELFPFGYSMLKSFAKGQPDKFYLDDRVQIKDKRKIYAIVGRLEQIRKDKKESVAKCSSFDESIDRMNKALDRREARLSAQTRKDGET